ncbi:MAG: hypothetical protein CME71_07205 [Halobacteriovorax sp.]|nr:hypothetical protein [Halobacteriovorax sp.]|tara:strand:- start:234 stop:425 length:192 start_codon:yes stop_codon:yes gene_type:complete
MKKFISVLFLSLLVTGVSFAGELGENMASDCVSTQQSSRFQQTLSDGQSSEVEQSSSSSSSER